MPLTAADIKLVKSKLMADVANGGGLPSGSVITDNVMNSIFPGVTRVERAGGGIAARKIFVHPQSNDTAQYFDAHAFVGKASDESVEIIIMPCDTFDETRSDLYARLNSPYQRSSNEYQIDGYMSKRVSSGSGSRSFITFSFEPQIPISVFRQKILDGRIVKLVGVDYSGAVIGEMTTKLTAPIQYFDEGIYPDGYSMYSIAYSLSTPMTDEIYRAPEIRIYSVQTNPLVRCYCSKNPSSGAAANADSVAIDPFVAVIPKRGALDPAPAIFGVPGLVKATYFDHAGNEHAEPDGISRDGYIRWLYAGDIVVIREGEAESTHSVIAVDYVGKNITIYPPIPAEISTSATVSSALQMGDLSAYIGVKFSQETWSNAWSDNLKGNAAAADFDDIGYPISISNKGAITERWAVRFTGANTVLVIGESVGVVANGLISAEISPINPATGTPYFTLNAAGWGSGWNYDNVLRFNTVSASKPFWLWRCVHPGVSAVTSDTVKIEVRGEIDA